MKKSRVSKSFLILLLLALFLSGCAGGAVATTATSSNSATTPMTTAKGITTATTTASTDPKYSETIKIRILSTDGKDSATNYDSSNPDRKSATENMWIKGYKKYLNIDVERIIAEDETALNAVINTSMASGDLSDVMIVSKSMFYVLAENGVLADLSKAYSSNQGALLKEAVATSPDSIDKGKIDGALLGFPVIGNSYNSSEVLWIRQDWLDKIGKSTPKTIDEMLEIAEAFQKAKLGGEKTIGLGMTDISSSFMAAYKVVMNTWQKDSAGKYVYADTTDAMKPGLMKLQEIYKKGIIKSDFAVTDILKDEVANGVVGMYYAPGWHGVTNIKANLLNDPNAKWVCCRIPTLDGNDVQQWTNNTIGQYYVVNKKYKNPEAIFKMIELELHMYYEPNKDELKTYYVCEDGYTAWNLRVFRNFGRADLDLYKSKIIQEGIQSKTASVAAIASSAYDRVVKGLAGDREQLGLALTYTLGYPIINKQLDKGLFIPSYDGPTTENMTLYQQTINQALKTDTLKVIMGADISVFEQAVKTWNATGGQAITKEINEYYSK